MSRRLSKKGKVISRFAFFFCLAFWLSTTKSELFSLITFHWRTFVKFNGSHNKIDRVFVFYFLKAKWIFWIFAHRKKQISFCIRFQCFGLMNGVMGYLVGITYFFSEISYHFSVKDTFSFKIVIIPQKTHWTSYFFDRLCWFPLTS